jgi:hypothetical protein
MMKIIRTVLFTLCIVTGVTLFAGQTNIPVVEFMDKSARISSDGAMPGWDIGFRRKFNTDFKFMVNQLQSDLANVKMEGESGGKTNFEIQISIILMHDCNPCKGENAVSEESFFVSLTFINATGKRLILEKIFTDKTHLIINGEPNVQETINRTWSQFQLTFIKDEQLKEIIKRITTIQDATLTFKAKNPSDELPMKADGKKKGILKITNLKTEKTEYPVGENPNNPLTEFELSCKNGFLIDKNGQEVKKITFKGIEFVENPNGFEYDYVVYNCDELCDKYDNFTLKQKSQNGVNLIREIKTLKEEFACYGYTLSLDYTETTPIYGTTRITATWNCVKIDFGKSGEMPDTLAMEALTTGSPVNTSGDPLTAPFIIPLETETGMIHVSAPIMNNTPVPYTFSCTGGNYAEFAGSFVLDFGEDNLTNPPDLILVKTNTPAQTLCGGVVRQGVYLDWQFDVWATLPELGYHQIFQVAATSCSELSNHPNNVDSRVPENVIPLMKAGKVFSFTKTNNLGATYTITGTPQ